MAAARLSALLFAGLAGATANLSAEPGPDLTPMGSRAAASADGRVPAWTPLIDPDFERGDHPYEDDEPLFVITISNLAEHEDLLTEGHKALFRTFPESYRMPVYPGRRGAAYPDGFNRATARNRERVKLTNGGNGFCCTTQGFPFPLPTNGLEVMWNHIMRYNTRGFRGYLASAATTPSGDYVIERAYVELAYVYNTPGLGPEELDNRNLYAMSKTVAPASKAGSAYLLHVPIDRIAQTTGVWVYSPGDNRARRIGEVGYDNPLFDGLMTQDQIDMFNGPLDRYTIKLLGRRQLIVPYNAYTLYDPELAYRDIITPGHINPEHTRYEVHRVWVIEAQVREGTSHRYQRRRFYVDEDTWIVLAQDIYDERDQFWRFAESHSVHFPQVPVTINGVQVHYDLQSRRYAIINLTNEERELIEYDWTATAGYFTPPNLRRFAASLR